MRLGRAIRSGLPILLGGALSASAAASAASDPCVKVAGLTFADPADVIACQKSFPFNETLRQNVLSVVSRVFDFYTFEDFYLNSPPPFQESTVNIRAELARINATKYPTDYDFNLDLYNFVNQLNDGHTGWFPNCYIQHQSILPAPVVILEGEVFVAPDSAEFLAMFGPDFANFFAAKKFNWQRLAGAKVLSIGGLAPFDYIDKVAREVTGTYLDHNVRVNSVVTSYRISNTDFSQRLGDLGGPIFSPLTSLKFTLIPVNSTKPEAVDVPYVSSYAGPPFTDGHSYWANNCAANNATNGVDRKITGPPSDARLQPEQPRLARAAIFDASPSTAVGLPGPFLPTLTPTNGSTGVIKSFILPGNKTGVMFVGSFEGEFDQFPVDVEAAVNQFKASGVKNVLIDVTNNGGGFVCLGLFLHSYLAGTNFGYPGFQSASRANPLAQKIVKADIALGVNSTLVFYPSDNWVFVNGTQMPANLDYNTPSVPVIVNGRNQPTSQRFGDVCPASPVEIPTTPPFDLKNVAIASNGGCASTCSLFTTVMFERHNTKIAVFGGNPHQSIQYKGMAGNQVLEFADLDSEVKTAGLKDDPLAPPDLLVNSNMRHNWRAGTLQAYSYLNEKVPIAYVSEQPQLRFQYTIDTYNNPQNLWTFASVLWFSVLRATNSDYSESKLFSGSGY
ncbi:hypothetical protein BC834DRAFT_982168 [Gloeopeniophorella convolvens]|nr:hypothetical protein BC834DRAFT_982168 [Gloeopeniophorella convolvens]